MLVNFIVENRTMLLMAFAVLSVVMGLITFIFYSVDKSKARRKAWRIPEAVLLSLPWLFGYIGGLFGVFAIRHKTKHWYFRVNNVLAFIGYIAILGGILFI